MIQVKTELTTLKEYSKQHAHYPSISKHIKNKILVKSNTTKKVFKNMVLKAKNYIKNGDIFQVVLSQRFESGLTKKPLEIYKKLRITNPSPFMFFFNFNDFQIIGSSPEILVRLRDKKVTIRSYLCSVGDKIAIKKSSQTHPLVIESIQGQYRDIPEYIQSDSKSMEGSLNRVPI